MSSTIEIHFEIDTECILNCLHCSKLNTLKNVSKRNLNGLFNFINSFSSNSIILIFTGGEPLLDYDNLFIDTVKKIKKNHSGIKIGFFTSGCIGTKKEMHSISSEFAHSINKIGIDFCNISVYSNKEKTHDSITRIKGSYNLTLESISNLIKNGITVNINLVILKQNKNDIKDIINHFSNLGVNEIRILRLVNHGHASENWNKVGVQIDQQRKIIEDALSLSSNKKNCILTVGGFPGLMSCQPYYNEKKCYAGIYKFYIDIYGNMYPCGCKKNDKQYEICHINDWQTSLQRNKYNPQIKCLQDID